MDCSLVRQRNNGLPLLSGRFAKMDDCFVSRDQGLSDSFKANKRVCVASFVTSMSTLVSDRSSKCGFKGAEFMRIY